MKRIFEFSITSTIDLDAIQLWESINNMQGINYELTPLVMMTVPKAYQNLTIEDAPIGEKLFKSIILLFKFIPVDIHHFRLDKVIANERFEENSTSLMHRFWKHKRVLDRVGNSTKITDTIQYYPRLPLIGYFLKSIYQFVFNYRHKRLRNKFNIQKKKKDDVEH